MSLELLKVIALLCQISAVEGTGGSFSRVQKIDQYQRQCVLQYIDCVGTPMNDKQAAEDLVKCTRARLIAE